MRKITITYPDEQYEWLEQHLEINKSGLFRAMVGYLIKTGKASLNSNDLEGLKDHVKGNKMDASRTDVERIVPTFIWTPNGASYYIGRFPFCRGCLHLDNITFLDRKCRHFVEIEGDEVIFSLLEEEVAA